MSELVVAAGRFEVLSRCLAVVPQLEAWRRTGDALPGTDAANALDQAVGELERLAAGDTAVLVERIRAVLEELPPPWD